MYGKIFERMFTGTMYGSGPVVFSVWSYVIANCKPPGMVELNPKMLASCIGTSTEEIREAIEFLCRPDAESANKAEEGRRLIHVSGLEYHVVSFEKYREMRDEEARREYQREWVANKRKKLSTTVDKESTDIDSRQVSTKSTKAEAEAEKRHTRTSARVVGLYDDLFAAFWDAYPKKKGKAEARKAFDRLRPDITLVGVMAAALKRQRAGADWTKDGGQFIPHASTWLNGRRWEDEDALPEKSAEPDWLRHAI